MDQSSQKRSDLMRTALAQGDLSTPGGFRKPSFVHIVRPNQSVVKRGGVSHLMDMVTSALVEPPATEIAQLNPANQSGGWVTWASGTTGRQHPSLLSPPVGGSLRFPQLSLASWSTSSMAFRTRLAKRSSSLYCSGGAPELEAETSGVSPVGTPTPTARHSVPHLSRSTQETYSPES